MKKASKTCRFDGSFNFISESLFRNSEVPPGVTLVGRKNALRSYNVTLPHKKISDPLCQLAKKMAAPAMPLKEDFQSEAAIVNYFGSGGMLGGHLDDIEADWSKPIVSMRFIFSFSLGCEAIFLLGVKYREDEPLAMFLRSGDIVLMAGEARECFHEQVESDDHYEENAEITPLEL